MNTCKGIVSVDSNRVTGDIIGRGVLWWRAMGEATDGKRLREENIGKDSVDLHYCQGLLSSVYHSNVRRGSGVD
jgi:hypothetical protein